MRSRKEIEKYLQSKEINETNISKVIELLKNNGYLNDNLYAESFINDKILLSSDGPLKIKKYLIENGIPNNIVEEKIQMFDKELEQEKINKQASRIVGQNEAIKSIESKV
jgi:regulatory protein